MGNVSSSQRKKQMLRQMIEDEPHKKPNLRLNLKAIKGNREDALDDCNPNFKFVPNFIEEAQRQELLKFTRSGLMGFDKTSEYFAHREKAFRFVMYFQKDIYCLSQDHFIQPSNYNDFSGGLKRSYDLIPEEVVLGPLRTVLLRFVEYHKLPERTVIQMHLQTTKPIPGAGLEDVTGQGIHTDGADRGMLLCIERDGVEGAQNLFHAALDGSEPLCTPTTLENGDAVYWKDNQCFHEVTDISVSEGAIRPVRTLLVVIADCAYMLNGTPNMNNVLSTNRSPTALRQVSPHLNSITHPTQAMKTFNLDASE